MSNLTSFQNSVYLHRLCVFEIFVRRAKMEFVELFHIAHGAAHILIHFIHADMVVPWTVKQSSSKSSWDHRVLPAPDSAIGSGFYKLLSVFAKLYAPHILYYNIGNHRNNCKTAFIFLYLFGSHTRRSALFLAWLSTHVSHLVCSTYH